jgi:hypothetical protein
VAAPGMPLSPIVQSRQIETRQIRITQDCQIVQNETI